MNQNIKIGIIVGCLVLSGVILYFTTFRDSSGGGGDYKVWIKCVNPDCAQTYSLTYTEFAKMQSDSPLQAPMGPMANQAPQAYKCIKCGQLSAYVAEQCEKCKNIFIRGEAGDEQDPDKCPKCGYSPNNPEGAK